MASRGMQPGFLNSSRGPARPAQSSSAWSRFLQNEILAPEKRAGNLLVLYGAGFFAAGVTLFRTVGADLFVPVL
ncbi:unnamed protein product [Tilletia controversa]|uniref:Uncharacterized protein n=3 Tax=Tilletia TaxID=13289 RepID=A0A8X7MVB4_9BASI|nr:hypothetical protein CF336_g2269 [Tilletia laevis]KAE8202453.1 hypothetical protein CF328_g2209 [Tilletia controversa]KAE8263216.1 hypothetical protein A4X03_0g1846 [Tilletia caries]KAE8208385.1 hypothetical protein CF335_g458 [Tilletia laevis]KAE8251316.1 hypothetical protein A4X06_0g2729 [Tilletia controversa]